MRKLLSNGMALFVGMVALPVPAINLEWPCLPAQHRDDPRLERLNEFFREMGDCPAQRYSRAFLLAADQHNLDWRLLPSISIVESGGGKTAHNNNYFGWDNGVADFPTPDAGIRLIASRLATSHYYRDKELDAVLRTYNPVGDYPRAVKSVMNQIAPSE